MDTKVGDTEALLNNIEILAVAWNGCHKSVYRNAMLKLLVDCKTW